MTSSLESVKKQRKVTRETDLERGRWTVHCAWTSEGGERRSVAGKIEISRYELNSYFVDLLS